MSFEIPAPRRTGAYRFGLIGSLGSKPLSSRINSDEPAVWERKSCALPLPFDTAVCPPVPVVNPQPTTNLGESEGVSPSGLYSAWACSSVANSQDQANAEAQRILDDGREGFVGKAFEAQLAAHPALQVIPNPGLEAPICGLARLEEQVPVAFGRGSVIFTTQAVASYWSGIGNAVEVVDGRLYTKLGTPVIVLSHTGGVTYVTDGIPDVYLSEVTTLEDDAAFRLRRDNTIIGVVEQQFLIAFDPCYLGVLHIDVCASGQ